MPTSVEGLRSPYEKVGGLFFFGRMLDKIRLKSEGRLPDGYNLGDSDPTCFDGRCTRFLSVDYSALSQRVLAGGSDAEILEWAFAIGRRPTQGEILIWNAFMSKRGWRDEASVDLAAAKKALNLDDRPDIQTYFDLHDADVGRRH